MIVISAPKSSVILHITHVAYATMCILNNTCKNNEYALMLNLLLDWIVDNINNAIINVFIFKVVCFPLLKFVPDVYTPRCVCLFKIYMQQCI